MYDQIQLYPQVFGVVAWKNKNWQIFQKFSIFVWEVLFLRDLARTLSNFDKNGGIWFAMFEIGGVKLTSPQFFFFKGENPKILKSAEIVQTGEFVGEFVEEFWGEINKIGEENFEKNLEVSVLMNENL